MATYTGTGNFSSSSTERYRLDVTVVTTQVTGGTEISVSANAVLFNSTGITPAFSSSGSRGYSVPGGRTGSTSGSLLTSGSATWSYDFGSNTTQLVWGGFNRYVAYSYGSSTTVTITASGSGSSFLGDASVTVNVPLFSASINYSIDYLGNGATGGSTGSTIATSSSSSYNLTVASNGFSRTGYTFTGWNTSSGGGGTSYNPGNTITLTSGSPTITLYAQWSQIVPVWTSGVDNYSTVRVGQGFSDYLVATNATSYTLVTAPTGLYIQDYGSYAYIFGTVSATSSGSRTITVRATSSSGATADSSDTFLLRQALPSWSDTSLANGTKGTFYSSTFSATGATSWSISGVPSGLSASGTSGATVTISGTPSVYGSQTISATPYNSDGDAGSSQNISFTLNDSAVSWVDQSISSTGRKNTGYIDAISATGGTSRSYAVYSGSLPPGVSLNSATGSVSGTPTAYDSYSFVIYATNADSSSTIFTNTLTIDVEDVALSWSDQLLASSLAVQDESYTDGVSVNSGPTTTYSIASGTLPDGMTLNTSTGAITGTPTVPNTYNFVVRATNGSGETLDTGTLSITVEAAGGYVKVWNGSAWIEGTAYVYNGSSWLEGTVQISNGSGWTDSFSS